MGGLQYGKNKHIFPSDIINSHCIGMKNRKVLPYQFPFCDILDDLKICKGLESSQQILSVPDFIMDFGKHVLQNKDESSMALSVKGDLSQVYRCHPLCFSYITVFSLLLSFFSCVFLFPNTYLFSVFLALISP